MTDYSKIDKKTSIVHCGSCGQDTFSRVWAESKRLPLQCTKCKKYFHWEK